MPGQERRLPPRPQTVDHYTITPDDIPNILGATRCHRDGITGDGIVVGIVDSGFYNHKYFEIRKTEWRQQYNTSAWNSPTTAHPPVRSVTGQYRMPEFDTDSSGHGTGMAANILAVAPGITLRLYPVQSFLESLEAAVQQCQIISLSKHSDVTGHAAAITRYRTALRNANTNGKIIFHCAGNGNSTPWPILNHPETVIKVSGVHRRQNGQLEASDYGRANQGNQRSDICGLCGMMPAGAYIWLPADPDRNTVSQLMPGWNLASGTSSATPQVAGVCALMMQARAQNGMPPLNMATAKSILRRTATRVNIGQSFDGVAANAQWCLLVNAERAVRMAIQ